jgi:4'-phosphopantetheinyl transferase
VPEPEYLRLSRTLSVEETARSRRLLLDALRRRFVVGRGMLRVLLGRYLGRRPSDVQIACASQGKPVLDEAHGSDIAFNVAHSKHLAVFAFARSAAVGVDVEHAEPGDCDAIVRQFFSPRECREYCALPAAQRPAAFIRAWTRKEACLKASGVGMSGSLADVEVTIAAEEPARVLSAGIFGDVRDWWLQDMPLLEDFVGAVAVRGGPRRMTLKRLQQGSIH